MPNTLNYELIDFTDGNLSGWTLLNERPAVYLAREHDNDFLVSKDIYAYNGMDFEKNVPGIEVGAYYAFSMDMRTYHSGNPHPETMGVQVILANGFAGGHIALRISVPSWDTVPGEWHTVEGYVFKRRETEGDTMLLNCYSLYQLDLDNIRLSLTPTQAIQVPEKYKFGAEPHLKR